MKSRFTSTVAAPTPGPSPSDRASIAGARPAVPADHIDIAEPVDGAGDGATGGGGAYAQVCWDPGGSATAPGVE